MVGCWWGSCFPAFSCPCGWATQPQRLWWCQSSPPSYTRSDSLARLVSVVSLFFLSESRSQFIEGFPSFYRFLWLKGWYHTYLKLLGRFCKKYRLYSLVLYSSLPLVSLVMGRRIKNTYIVGFTWQCMLGKRFQWEPIKSLLQFWTDWQEKDRRMDDAPTKQFYFRFEYTFVTLLTISDHVQCC